MENEKVLKALNELEVLVIEDNKDKALELIRTTKKELVNNLQRAN